MSGIETYGGKCPNCTKPMFQKYDSSTSALLFDACAHCGFIYGTLFEEGKGVTAISNDNADQIWLQILHHHNVATVDELIGHYATYETGEDIDDFYPSIFDYSGDTAEEIQSRVIDLDKLKFDN